MTESYTFLDCKTLYIKILNGDLFSIEINDFDKPSTLIEKIIENSKDKTYKLREHRMKFFIENKENQKENSYDYISNIDISVLNNEDVLCIISESPDDPISVLFPHQFFNLKSEEIKTSNNFIIRDLISIYDAIDNIYFQNYDSNIPIFFQIDLKQEQVQMKHIVELEKLIEIIPFQDCSKDILFQTKGDYFITDILLDLLTNYFKKLSYICVRTLGLDIYLSCDKSMELLNVINSKSFYIQNLYLSSYWFYFFGFKSHMIDLSNIPNIYIFQSFPQYEVDTVDYFLKKFKSLNNTIYISYRYANVNNTNNQHKPYSNWIIVGSSSKNVFIYRHIKYII